MKILCVSLRSLRPLRFAFSINRKEHKARREESAENDCSLGYNV
jgi:hypothetical protein